ncbi:MAG: acyltransferase [Candidatus Korobacteraceae bacterium]
MEEHRQRYLMKIVLQYREHASRVYYDAVFKIKRKIPANVGLDGHGSKLHTQLQRGSSRRMNARSYSSRIPQLDLLRGIAVLLVIGVHYPYIHILGRIGWIGVDLFFVLSGFLISGLLFADWKRSGTIHLKRFFIRRGFKIYPSFYAFLILALPLVLFRYGRESIPRISAEASFMQDYFRPAWGHTWSLGVEEKFYIALPFVLLALSQMWKHKEHRGFALIPLIAVVLLAGCLWARLVGPFNCFHSRADDLFCGVALGYWFHFHQDSFHAFSRWWLFPLFLALLTPLFLFQGGLLQSSILLTCNALAFSALLVWILPRTWVRVPLLERIGFYSYSIYLWHYVAAKAASTFGVTALGLVSVVVFSCLVGIGMAKLIEVPALALRDRLFPAVIEPHGHGVSVTANAPSIGMYAPPRSS